MKITFDGFVPLPDGAYERNIEAAKARRLPSWRELRPSKTRLAVVGGGPSTLDQLNTLSNWDGDIWAINGTWKWLWERGIDAVFFSLDPLPLLVPHVSGLISHALVATCCDPQVFERLKYATVHTFDVGQPGSHTGSSTATGVPCIAINMGYREIVFFGCESSFDGQSHAYSHEERTDDLMLVRCDGADHLTYCDFYQQAQELATFMRTFPDVITERSGGLLRAMVNDPEHDVVAGSQALHDRLKPVCACGCVEKTCWDCEQPIKGTA